MSEKDKVKIKRELEIRSQAVDEIIGHPPAWIVRWGITLFFFIAVGLLTMTWVFKYPDIIQAPATIITENVPAFLTAKTSGRIVKTFYTEGDTVKKDSRIALIENSADYKDINLLEMVIDSFTLHWSSQNKMQIIVPEINTTIKRLEKDFAISNLSLGSIDNSWTAFYSKWNELADYIEKDYDGQKIEALKTRLQYFKQLSRQFNLQSELADEDFKLTRKQYGRDSCLFIKKVISELEYENSKKVLLQKTASLELQKSSQIQSNLQCNDTEQSIIELENNKGLKINQYFLQINQLFSALRSSLDQWKQTYLVVSPVNGRISFPKVWTENQNILTGEPVATIVPFGKSSIIGKVKLPVSGSGKVKIGQKVILKLDNYPYMEYGMVYAKIENISLVPSENSYLVELSFPNGLISNYNQNLEYRDEMTGSAEIITEDMRLIERLISPLKYLTKSQLN